MADPPANDVSILSPIPLWVHPFGDLVRPDRALPVAWSFGQYWLPRLGLERWGLLLSLRLAIAAGEGLDGMPVTVESGSSSGGRHALIRLAHTNLAPWLGMTRKRLARLLAGERLPADLSEWWDEEASPAYLKLFTFLHLGRLAFADPGERWQWLTIPKRQKYKREERDQARYLRLFIPRLRVTYAGATSGGGRSGIELELLIDDLPPPEMIEQRLDFYLCQLHERARMKLDHYPGPLGDVASVTTKIDLNHPSGLRSILAFTHWLWQNRDFTRFLLRPNLDLTTLLRANSANYTYDTDDPLSANAERDTTSSSLPAAPTTATIQPSSSSARRAPGGNALEAGETAGIAVLSPGGISTLTAPILTPQPGGLPAPQQRDIPITRDGGAVAGNDVWAWQEREKWTRQVAEELKQMDAGKGNITGRLVQAAWDLLTIAGRPGRADFDAFEALPQGTRQVWQRVCALDRRVALAGQPLTTPLETLWQALAGASYPVETHQALGLSLTAIEWSPDKPGIVVWQRRTAWIASIGSDLERLGRGKGNAAGRLGTALWELCRLPSKPDTDAYAALGRLAKEHGATAVWWQACGLSAQAAAQGRSLTRPVELLQAAFAPAASQVEHPLQRTAVSLTLPAAAGNVPPNPLLTEVLALYQDNFDRPAPLMKRKIEEAVAEYPNPEGWKIAFSYACEPGVAKPWGYIREILAERHRRGLGGAGEGADEETRAPAGAQTAVADTRSVQATASATVSEHARLWQMALDDLRLQVPRDSFDAWLADTWAVGIDDNTLIVAVSSARARDWLRGSLGKIVTRVLRDVSGHLTNAQFVIIAGKSMILKEEE